MAGMGRAFLAGVQGFDAGVDRALALQDREREIARQEQADQWAQEDRAGVVEDRALAREERGMRVEDIKLNRTQRKLMAQLASAYASRDPAQLDALYEAIPDGQSLSRPSEMTEDGRVRIHHPMGELQGSWDEAFFGNPGGPDGSGFSPGLIHFINPELLLTQRSGAAERAAEIAAADRKHGQRLEVEGMRGANSARAAGIRANAALEAARVRAGAAGGAGGRAPTVKTLADGTMVQWNGTAWVPATMQGEGGAGVPMRGAVPAGVDPMRTVNADIGIATRAILDPSQLTPETIAAGAQAIQASRDAIAAQRGLGVGSAPPQAVAVQPGAAATNSTPTAAGPDASGYEIGKVYEDDQGNRAIYRGNGQWEEQ